MLFSKDSQGRIDNLLDIKNKIETFLDLAQNNTNYIGENAMKLRLLYFRKSGTDSLLEQICDDLNIDIFVRDTDMHESFAELISAGMVFGVHYNFNSWFGNVFQTKIKSANTLLKEALLFNNYCIDNSLYSLKNIIETYADKYVAHIDKAFRESEKDLTKLVNSDVEIGGLKLMDSVVYSFSIISLHLISIIEDYLENGIENEFIKKRQ